MMLLLLLALIGFVVAQNPIPNRYDGFRQGTFDSPILFEMYGDLLCPDTNEAWSNLQAVLQYYNPPKGASTLLFYFHEFPLPSIHNSFILATGAAVIADQYPNMIWEYVNLIFDNQQSFWGTVDQTTNQVMKNVSNLVSKNLSGITSSTFFNLLTNDTYSYDASVSFKFGASRAVTSTPTFMVNGVGVMADPTWTLSDWQFIIEPLLGNDAPMRFIEKATPPTCPNGETLCQYLPSQWECCTPGEECIKNVGCRC